MLKSSTMKWWLNHKRRPHSVTHLQPAIATFSTTGRSEAANEEYMAQTTYFRSKQIWTPGGQPRGRDPSERASSLLAGFPVCRLYENLIRLLQFLVETIMLWSLENSRLRRDSLNVSFAHGNAHCMHISPTADLLLGAVSQRFPKFNVDYAHVVRECCPLVSDGLFCQLNHFHLLLSLQFPFPKACNKKNPQNTIADKDSFEGLHALFCFAALKTLV